MKPRGSEVPALYRVQVRTADGREFTSAPVVVSPEAYEGQEGAAGDGQRAPVLYRFKARTADGKEVTSAIVLGWQEAKPAGKPVEWKFVKPDGTPLADHKCTVTAADGTKLEGKLQGGVLRMVVPPGHLIIEVEGHIIGQVDVGKPDAGAQG